MRLAARPDLVYGLYRVPDRIRPSAGPGGAEGGRVGHRARGDRACSRAPSAPTDIYFDAEATWVARRIGEPSVLDEDLALAYLDAGGDRPGADARHRPPRAIDPRGGDGEASESRMTARVRGVHAFHPRSVGGSVAHDMGAAAPLDLPAGPPAGVHVELVNWDVIARAVHPVRQQRPCCRRHSPTCR